MSGWIGLTVLGSLAHLLAVVVRVRGGFTERMPAARPRLDGFLPALAMVGVASLALSQSLGLGGLGRSAVLALLAAYAILAARVAVLSAQVLLRARPRL